MENPETFYLTADEYRAQTKQPTLVGALNDAQVEALLIEAMVEIDAYTGLGHVPYDEEQEFVFPRDIDLDEANNPIVPRYVALATRMVADAIIEKEKGWKGFLQHELQSESLPDYSYTLRKGTDAEQGFEHWPAKVFMLLSRYRNFGGQLAVSGTEYW